MMKDYKGKYKLMMWAMILVSLIFDASLFISCVLVGILFLPFIDLSDMEDFTIADIADQDNYENLAYYILVRLFTYIASVIAVNNFFETVMSL